MFGTNFPFFLLLTLMLIKYGSSERVAHVWTVIVNLIYLRHFLALSQSFKQFLSVSLYICKTYSELPTYISITLLILFLPLARSIHSIFLHLLRPYLEMSILSCSFQSPWKNNAFHADLFLLTLLRSFFLHTSLAYGWNFAFMHVLAWVLQKKIL